MDNQNKRKGFTLVELLVVISIIGLLASIVLVSLNNARGKARDARRITEMKQIMTMLELYIDKNGSLPSSLDYGEGNSSPAYWDGWWDVSIDDRDGDGRYFLDFLVEDGIASVVPLDPINTPLNQNTFPTADGYYYVYFVAPRGYIYQGGSCVVSNQSVYLIGIRKFERAARGSFGSGCPCLWQNLPNMFQSGYDYIACGYF